MKVLRRLEQIGGEIEESEVVYQLGKGAVLELFEAESEGLVISKTTFELSKRGKALVGESAS
jgi:hypothetical protein